MSPARTLIALFALYGCAGEAATGQADPVAAGRARPAAGAASLDRAVARAGAEAGGPVWVAWEVPATSRDAICCFDGGFRRSTCRLEERQRGWGTSSDAPPGSGRLQVLARWERGEVGRILAVDSACPVDTGSVPLVRLAEVAVEDSVEWLAALAAGERDGEGEPLAALAGHAGPAATRALERLASEPFGFDLREKALFWIGQSRGEEGARFLAGVVRSDADDDLREKAIFSLSQNDSPLAAETLVDTARRDPAAEVRGQALFWLAQTREEEAEPVLLAALDEDPSPKVREQAIFAMTQLEDGGVPLLVGVARDPRRDRELRRQALFWLGQSKDPRAFDFLEEILER